MENEVVVSQKTALLAEIEKKMTGMLAEQVAAFPKGFNQVRFIQNCMVVLADTKDIDKCKPISVVRTLIKGAYLGLDFFRRECYAIPYRNKDTGELEANFQTDVKGEVKLCLTYGRGIKDIYAKLVREGDDFNIGIVDGIQHVNFAEKPFNDGKIIGAFAVVIYENGVTRYDSMSVEEIEGVRKNYSKMPDSKMWKNSFGEACKKTVIRRLCKMISLQFDNIEQEKAYDAGGDAEFQKEHGPAEPKKADNPFAKEGTTPTKEIVQDAEIVETDPDDALKAELKKKHPEASEWEIENMIDASRKGV